MNYCIDCGADIPGTDEYEGVYLCATCAREHDTPAEGAAIVCPDGGTIYTSEEYDRAKRNA